MRELLLERLIPAHVDSRYRAARRGPTAGGCPDYHAVAERRSATALGEPHRRHAGLRTDVPTREPDRALQAEFRDMNEVTRIGGVTPSLPPPRLGRRNRARSMTRFDGSITRNRSTSPSSASSRAISPWNTRTPSDLPRRRAWHSRAAAENYVVGASSSPLPIVAARWPNVSCSPGGRRSGVECSSARRSPPRASDARDRSASAPLRDDARWRDWPSHRLRGVSARRPRRTSVIGSA